MELVLPKATSNKMNNILSYSITAILQYCWDKRIARSGDMMMNRDDLGIFSLFIKCFGITNIRLTIFEFSSVKNCTEVFAETVF